MNDGQAPPVSPGSIRKTHFPHDDDIFFHFFFISPLISPDWLQIFPANEDLQPAKIRALFSIFSLTFHTFPFVKPDISRHPLPRAYFSFHACLTSTLVSLVFLSRDEP